MITCESSSNLRSHAFIIRASDDHTCIVKFGVVPSLSQFKKIYAFWISIKYMFIFKSDVNWPEVDHTGLRVKTKEGAYVRKLVGPIAQNRRKGKLKFLHFSIFIEMSDFQKSS